MLKSTRKNRACLFHDLNQWLEKETKMFCTILWMFINAKYNGVIWNFTMDEVKAIAKSQNLQWEFDYKNWAYTKDSNDAFLEYLDSKGIEYNCLVTKDDTEVLEWIERWYAVWIGIWVNNKFLNDRKDGKIDWFDYSEFKWNIGHFCNFAKWTARWTITDWKEMCIDSYFVTNSTYDCDIKKVLQEIDQSTKYIIF